MIKCLFSQSVVSSITQAGSLEVTSVLKKLESSDTRWSNFIRDQGVQNSLCIKTSSSKYSFSSKSGGGGKFASGSRDPNNASERCNKGRASISAQFF